MKKLNILIVAHEFSPEQGSECSEGWNLVTRIANYHNVTVLYASGSQFNHNAYVEAVDRYFKNNSKITNLNLVNIDQPKISKFIASFNAKFLKISPVGLPFFYFIGYKYWQKLVFSKAKKIAHENDFHCIHQLTQITFREPGYLWKLKIPFVWGPTGGTATIPKGFLPLLSRKSKILEHFRTFSNFYQFKFVSRIIQANRLAAIIYTFSKEDAIKFKKRATGEIKLMLDAGTILTDFSEKPFKKEREQKTAVWCGQLVERKAPTILLEAIAKGNFHKKTIKFIIIGDGYLKEHLLETAKKLEIYNIEWINNINREKVFEIMKSADFFVHTSFREATSNVIPEALSMGLPVICHDANGMSIAINETCGIKVPLISVEESIDGFKNAIAKLISDDNYLQNLQKGAISRTREISWDSMAEIIASDYTKIVNANANFINK